MKQLFDNLAQLGKRRLILMGVTATGLVVALALGLGVAMTPNYRPFVTDATAATAAQIIKELEKSGFNPKNSNDGTVISLPEGDIARARMALAEAGMPPPDTSGWALFDKTSTIGMNSFMQQINRLRALEGELVLSIKSIDVIDDARVHLVLPDREAFSQDRAQATASVIIRTIRGQTLERSQALAVRSLVAAAVPGLSPGRVTVLTSAGQTILGEEGAQNGMDDAQIEIEERLRRNIESILGAHVGAENVRVRVTAELETERRVVVEQSYNADQAVPRVVTSSNEESNSHDTDAGSVDVANNLAAISAGPESGGSSESRARQTEEKQFDVGSVRSELVKEPGSIKRITVAALVNGVWLEKTYNDRGSEELDQLAALVRTAAGINEARGDIVTVESLQFAEGPAMMDGADGSGWRDMLGQNLGTLIRSIVALVVVALVLVLVVRPAMRQLSAARPPDGANGLAALDGLGGPMAMAMVGPMALGRLDDPLALPDSGAEEFLSFSSVQGNVMRRYVDDFARIVENEPEAAVRTIRAWINQRG